MFKNIKKLEEQLNFFLLKKNEPIVISLQGYWGIGKTYFWNKHVDNVNNEKNKKRKFVYISLFGINSIDEIKSKIIIEISKLTKGVKKVKKIIGNSKVLGIDISSVFSILEKEDFQNLIVCVDDFERLSPNLNISEVLGFISELKEQYKCKVVMINNNDILKEQDMLDHQKIIKRKKNGSSNDEFLEKFIFVKNNNYEILEKFSEKIIDVTLRYEPIVKELVDIIRNKEKTFIDYDFIEELFNSLQNNNKKFNLRLMKQLNMKLEIIEVEEILKDKEILEEYKRGLILDIFKKIINDENFEKNYNKPEKVIMITYHIKDELENIISRHYIDNIETIKNILKEKSKLILRNNEIDKYKNKIQELYFKYLFDLQYDDQKFAHEFFNLLSNKKFEISKIIGLSNIAFYVQLLINIDKHNEKKYLDFFKELVKKYIKENFTNIEQFDIFKKQDFMKLLEKVDLDKYFNEIMEKNNELKSQQISCSEILKNLNDILEKGGWNHKIENLLNKISKNKIKDCLINDYKFFEIVFEFVRFLQSFSGNVPFRDFYNSVIEIYKELYKDEKYKNKIKLLLEILNIKVD